MKRPVLLCVIVIFSLIISSCNYSQEPAPPSPPPAPPSPQEYPVVLEETGTVVAEKPQRVVCLSPSLTEILYTLGYGKVLVGVGEGCDYPAQVENLMSTGNSHNPDIEALRVLAPGYLLLSSNLVEEDLIQIQQLGIIVVKIPPARSLADLERVYTTLGGVLGGQITGAREGRELYEAMTSRIGELSGVLKKADKSCYLIRMLNNTLATGDTFIGDVLQQLGFRNLAEDSTGWALAADQVAQTNPDILFVDRSVDIEAVKACALYKDSNAVRNGAIYPVDTLLFERQSKRLIQELERMGELSYPEGFQGVET